MEYPESACLLPCEGGGTAGISAISFTGESKLGISSSFSVMEFLLRFFVLSMTAYTAVVESAIMNDNCGIVVWGIQLYSCENLNVSVIVYRKHRKRKHSKCSIARIIDMSVTMNQQTTNNS
jgi:hypothetical protein